MLDLGLEEFMDFIILALLPFYSREFKVGIWNLKFLSRVKSKINLVAEFALSFPLTLMWDGIQHIRISLLFDI